MLKIRPIWKTIVIAAFRGEWLGWDYDDGYVFRPRDTDEFQALAPATAIRDLLADRRLGEFVGVSLVIAGPEDERYLYPHPGIDVLVIGENRRVLGPLDANGVRREVRVADE